MSECRAYNLNLAQLIDLLGILTLKSIRLNHKKEFEMEARLVMADIDKLMRLIPIDHYGKFIRAVQIGMLSNNVIWMNETIARQGGSEQDKYLKFTHTCNGMRRRAGNAICNLTGENIDLNLDTVNEPICKEFGYDFSELF